MRCCCNCGRSYDGSDFMWSDDAGDIIWMKEIQCGKDAHVTWDYETCDDWTECASARKETE